MCRLEEEMQQARKKFAAEKQKLTEELVCHAYFRHKDNYHCDDDDDDLSCRMELSQNIRLKWTKIGR